MLQGCYTLLRSRSNGRGFSQIIDFTRRHSKGNNLGDEAFLQNFKEREKLQQIKLPVWKKRDLSNKKRYGDWNPSRKLSRQQMQDLRDMKEQMPHLRTIDLANHFQISPESIRRILKSRWVPSEDIEDDILNRVQRRKEKISNDKKSLLEEISTARKRLGHGRSITLNDSDSSSRLITSDQLYSQLSEKHNNSSYKAADFSKNDRSKKYNHAKRKTPFIRGAGDSID